MRRRVYSILAGHFKKWGVTHVFGIPGKSVSPLMLELDSLGINYILSRHESGAGFEAAGYALMKKTIGIAIGTSGPGGTNMITSAGQAKAYHLPVLFITGHPSMKDTGRALGQDSSCFGADLAKMFEPVTLFSARVDRADLLPAYLRHAIEKACTGAKGPVHLCVPFDVLMEEMEPFDTPLTDVSPVVSPVIDRVIPLLDNAHRPVLFLGKGVIAAEAFDEVRILAEHWGIPVMTTPGGKGAFPTAHPLCLGGFGLGGTEEASSYLKSGIDLMIVAGSKLSDMSLSGFSPEMYPKQVIQFDYDLTFVGKSIPVPTLAILGDMKENFKKLLDRVNASFSKDRIELRTESGPEEQEEGRPLSAARAVQVLRAHLPREAVMFGDDGSHTFYAIRHFEILEPGTFFFDDVFGAMGHAIGYAIGAKAGEPQKTIVCLTGDGCAMMHGTEFSTAANYCIPVIFVVFNNGRLDMVDKGMSYHTGRSVGAVYAIPLNVAQYAESMGVPAFRCHTGVELGKAVQSALASKLPTVIEVMVDPSEIPPILTRLLILD